MCVCVHACVHTMLSLSRLHMTGLSITQLAGHQQLGTSPSTLCHLCHCLTSVCVRGQFILSDSSILDLFCCSPSSLAHGCLCNHAAGDIWPNALPLHSKGDEHPILQRGLLLHLPLPVPRFCLSQEHSGCWQQNPGPQGGTY
jgi:hypothetical protein